MLSERSPPMVRVKSEEGGRGGSRRFGPLGFVSGATIIALRHTCSQSFKHHSKRRASQAQKYIEIIYIQATSASIYKSNNKCKYVQENSPWPHRDNTRSAKTKGITTMGTTTTTKGTRKGNDRENRDRRDSDDDIGKYINSYTTGENAR